MSIEEKLIERANEISSSCILGPLQNDIDKMPIGREDFNQYRIMLNDNLHLLLDILYQNRCLLVDQAHDNQLIQLRVNLLLLFCEQTETNPYFQTDQKILISSLVKLIDDSLVFFDDIVVQKVIQTHKEKLKKDCWKKQLGMIHGFPKFCEVLLKQKPEAVNSDVMMFVLSVGSNLVCHHDPHYKTIGLKVYRHIVESGKTNLLKEMNIHEVIYSDSFKMLRKSAEIDYNDHLYEVLFHVVLMEDDKVSDSKWCKFDDVIDALLRQYGIESEAIISAMLLKKIVKFCLLEQSVSVLQPPENNLDQLERHYMDLKLKLKHQNHRTMRWIKKLMEMMIRESPRLMSSSSDCFTILNSFHSMYLIVLFKLEATSLGQQLTDFTRKLVLVLMQVLRTFKDDQSVKKSIELFLATIKDHQSSDSELSSSIQNILSHKMFQ